VALRCHRHGRWPAYSSMRGAGFWSALSFLDGR
jgi:hypothetical protein